MHMYRYFDGKLYEFAGKKTTKSDAEHLENRLRKSGFLVRIIHSGKASYLVFGKKKGTGPYESQ
jgi:hypothetical protein